MVSVCDDCDKSMLDADIYAKAYNPVLLARKAAFSFSLSEITDDRGRIVISECQKIKQEFISWLNALKANDSELGQVVEAWFTQELYPRMTGNRT